MEIVWGRGLLSILLVLVDFSLFSALISYTDVSKMCSDDLSMAALTRKTSKSGETVRNTTFRAVETSFDVFRSFPPSIRRFVAFI